MKKTLVLATHNRHKVREIRKILKTAGLSWRLLTLDAFPSIKPTVEDRKTIEGNARKKALEVARATGFIALADDTGLFVSALKGAPGVYSARFAGPKCNFSDNNKKVLRLLKKVPASRRGASFQCVAALARPDGKSRLSKGVIRGEIAVLPQGQNGFGYDPIFYVPAHKKTFAQMPDILKNKISHRYLAFKNVPVLLTSLVKMV